MIEYELSEKLNVHKQYAVMVVLTQCIIPLPEKISTTWTVPEQEFERRKPSHTLLPPDTYSVKYSYLDGDNRTLCLQGFRSNHGDNSEHDILVSANRDTIWSEMEGRIIQNKTNYRQKLKKANGTTRTTVLDIFVVPLPDSEEVKKVMQDYPR